MPTASHPRTVHPRSLALLLLAVITTASAAAPAADDAHHPKPHLKISPEIALDQPILGPATGHQASPALASDGAQIFAAWTDYRAGEARVYGARVSPDGVVLDPVGIDLGPGSGAAVASGGGRFLVAYTAASGPSKTLRGALLDGAGARLTDFDLSAPGKAGDAQIVFDGARFVVAWASGGSVAYRARVTPAGAVLDPGGVPTASDVWRGPAIAFDGAQLLLAYQSSAGEIRGVRVDSQNAILDPGGFPIAAPEGWVSGLSLAFDGANYVAAWSELGPEANSVRAARVSSAATVLDPGGILVHEEPDWFYEPWDIRAASDGSGALVSWTRRTPEQWMSEAYLARLSQGGAVLGAPALVTPNGEGVAAAAAAGEVFLAWTAKIEPMDQTIAGARLGPGDALLDDPPLVLSTSANGQREPTVAFDGQSFLVAWSDDRGAASQGLWDIRATRLAPSGAVLDPGGIALGATATWQQRPRASHDGTSTVVAFRDCAAFLGDGDMICDGVASRVDAQGGVLDPAPIPLGLMEWAEPPRALAVSSGGGGTLLAGAVFMQELRYGFLSQGGAVSPLAAVEPYMGLGSTAAAFDGANHLLVWTTEDGSSVLGARVTPQGNLLDPGGFLIATAAGSAGAVAVASNGHRFLVVWKDDTGGGASIRAARVTPAGVVVDPMGMDIAAHPGCADVDLDPSGVAYDGRGWLVAWSACGLHSADVLGAALAGGTLVAAFAITSDHHPDSAPALATNGHGKTLAAYSSFRSEAPFGARRALVRRIKRPANP